MKKKSKKYHLELQLGLSLIILVLLILNIASHYTIFKVRQSLETQLKDDLSEAALVVINNIYKFNRAELADTIVDRIRNDYTLDELSIVHLNYERALSVEKKERPDSLLLALDSSITAEDLTPILHNRPTFRHRSGDKRYLLLFPSAYAGSKYIIAVGRSYPLLGSLENAGRILIFFGILGAMIISYAAFKFIRFAEYPFKHLKEEAKRSGRLEETDEDEVAQVISSYEKIITDLRRNEQELIRLNRLMTEKAANLEVYNNYILKSINAGIITLDAGRNISSVNRAAGEVLGICDSESVDAVYDHVFGDYPELKNLIDRFFATGEPVCNQEIEICGDSKCRLILSVSISPLTDTQSREIGVSIIFNDQTGLKKLQEELELKRRMASLGEMSGGLAHQLRNSVAAMVGFARLIGKKIEADGSVQQNIGHFLREAGEAEALVTRFLDFAGPLEMRCTEVDVDRLLAAVVAGAEEKYENVEISFERPSSYSGIMSGDQLLLKQALDNVVDNACKASGKEKGQVRIRIGGQQDSLTVDVCDNGPGIPEEFKDKIFTPFFSGSPSGTGLGLPLARKIITMHEGSLDFESVPGKGTTFSITFPRSQSTAKHKRITQKAPSTS